MCRKQSAIGLTLLAAGAGILLSLLFRNVFLSILFAAGLILGGILLLSSSS